MTQYRIMWLFTNTDEPYTETISYTFQEAYSIAEKEMDADEQYGFNHLAGYRIVEA